MKSLSIRFLNIKDHWRQTWEFDKPSFFFELFGTIFSILASGMLSFLATNPPILIIFIFYLIGSLCFTVSSLRKKVQAWIFVLMIWYNFVNIFGILNIVLNTIV